MQNIFRYLILAVFIVAMLPSCAAKPVAQPEQKISEVSNDNSTIMKPVGEDPRMQRGSVDPDWSVDVYQPELAWNGTTLFADNHNPERPRIVEVNMLGEIIWKYDVPYGLRQFNNPGFHTEILPGGNILFVLPRNGVYEIDRSGKVAWSFLTERISHDAHRLPDGNTIFVCGDEDRMNEAQVRVVNPQGQIVWSWQAGFYFNKPPYNSIYEQGWTHTNAVTRLPDGKTLISLRNFGLVVEVDISGKIIRTIGEGVFIYQHDPELLTGGNILVANHSLPQQAMEIDPVTNTVIWQFTVPQELLRDADRLPNGNTLITGASQIVEVTRGGIVAWRLTLKTKPDKVKSPSQGFYKSARTGY